MKKKAFYFRWWFKYPFIGFLGGFTGSTINHFFGFPTMIVSAALLGVLVATLFTWLEHRDKGFHE